MTGSQKALKIISIIMIVLSVVVIGLGIFMAVGASVLDPNAVLEGTDVSVGVAAVAIGIMGVAGGIIDLIIGLLGLRGAKNPSKIVPFIVLCIIGLVLSGCAIISGLVGGTFNPTDLIEVALIAVCLYLALQVKKLA